MAPRVKLVVFSAITFLLTIVVAEGILNLLAAGIPSVGAVLTPAPIRMAVTDPVLGWRGNPDYPEHDRLGFRNRNVPREAAVVALGDSQTYGTGVDRDEAWPQQLERLIGQRTYHLAFPGWGPIQGLVLLEAGLPVQPRLVISALYAGNDLADAYLAVYPRAQRPELRSTDERVLQAIADQERRDSWATKMARGISIEPSEPPWFSVENTRVYGLWRAIQRGFARATSAPEQDDERTQDDATYPQFNNGRLWTTFDPGYRLVALDPADPRIVEGLRITLATIEAQSEHARAQGAQFVVLLIPTKELVFRQAVAGSSVEASTDFLALMAYEATFWETTRSELTSRGIPYIDALPTLRSQVESGTQPYPRSTNGHPNRSGQRALAELVRGELERTGLLALMPR
jgi:lysophospholipase L1-like esterase